MMKTAGPWAESLESIPVTAWAAQADGRICYVNRRWSDWSGLPPEDLLGVGWMNLLHPDDRPGVSRAYAQAIAAETSLRTELRMRVANGAYKWVRFECEPARDAGAAAVRWYGVFHDIEEAHSAQSRFRVLSEALPIIAWSADADGWIDWYNHRWYDYTGQTPEEARGWGWQAAHHPDDFPEVMRRWPRSLETGEPFEMEFRLRRHDGVFRWFLTRVEPMRDETGKIVRWYGTNIDIDAQKKAEERSKRIAETLQDVFLPKSFPHAEDLRLDAEYIAAEKDALIGGDWYDAFDIPDGRIAFSIGDVAGHGLEASVLVGRMRQAIYTLTFKNLSPSQVLADANVILHHQNPETFVTAIVGYVSADHTQITFANAGHPSPIRASQKSMNAEFARGGGLPLGVSLDAQYEDHVVNVGNGDLIVLYTDGMTEFGRDIAAAEEKLAAAAVLFATDSTVARPARAIQQIVLDDSAVTDDAVVLTITFSSIQPLEDDAEPAPEQRWRFHSSDALSAQTARLEIGAYLRRYASEEADVFQCELIAGEVLANTVEHAPGLVEVGIDWSAARPVMTVRDAGPGMTAALFALPDDPLSENGRGLFLIKNLALDLAIKASPGFGSEIRVTLPILRNKRDRNPRQPGSTL